MPRLLLRFLPISGHPGEKLWGRTKCTLLLRAIISSVGGHAMPAPMTLLFLKLGRSRRFLEFVVGR